MEEREPFIGGIQDTVGRYGFRFESTHYGQPPYPFLRERYWGYDHYQGQPKTDRGVVTLDIAAVSEGGLDILFNGISIQAMIEDGIPSGVSLIQPPPYNNTEEVRRAVSVFCNLEGWRRLRAVE